MKKRSLGLTILGWFEILMGGGGSVLTLFAIVCAVWSALNESSIPSWNQIFLLVLYVFSVAGLFSIVLFISGIGLVKRNSWVLKFNIFITPIALIIYVGIRFSLLKWAEGIDKLYLNTIAIYLFIVIQSYIIYFLTRPKVRAQFFTNKLDINANHSKEENAL